jgi:anti-anti-sigma factor
MADGGKPEFSYAAGVLRVNAELDEVDAASFEEEVERLVSADVAAPVLDLEGISFVPSYHVAGIRTAADKCARSGRSMTIRARRNVNMMLDRMGVGALARLHSTDE